MSRKYVNLPLEKARVVNGLYRDGAVYPAFAPAEAYSECPEGLRTLKYVSGSRIFIGADGEKFYMTQTGKKFVHVTGLASSVPPPFCEEQSGGLSRGVLVGDDKTLTVAGESVGGNSVVHGLSCVTVHSGRLFGADKDNPLKLVWYGDNGADGDGGEGLYAGGYVYLDPERGGILDLVNLGGKICAVREYGVSEITAGGSPDFFEVGYENFDSPKAYARTAQVLGGRAYFYTERGLCSYNGGAVRREEGVLCGDLYALTDSAALGGCYFACGTSRTLGRKAILVYDTLNCSCGLVDLPADLLAAGEEVLAVCGALVYRLTGGAKVRTAQDFDFGTPSVKCLTKIEAECGGEAEITVSDGEITRTVKNVRGGCKLAVRGRRFTVGVECAGPVYAVKALAEETDGL